METRIALIDLPLMLRQILRRMMDTPPRQRVVAELPASVRLLDAVDDYAAHVLIGGEDALDPAEIEGLLAVRPGVRAVTIEDSGHRGFLYELRPQKIALGELSAHTLLEAIGEPSGCGGREHLSS